MLHGKFSGRVTLDTRHLNSQTDFSTGSCPVEVFAVQLNRAIEKYKSAIYSMHASDDATSDEKSLKLAGFFADGRLLVSITGFCNHHGLSLLWSKLTSTFFGNQIRKGSEILYKEEFSLQNLKQSHKQSKYTHFLKIFFKISCSGSIFQVIHCKSSVKMKFANFLRNSFASSCITYLFLPRKLNYPDLRFQRLFFREVPWFFETFFITFYLMVFNLPQKRQIFHSITKCVALVQNNPTSNCFNVLDNDNTFRMFNILLYMNL